MPTEFTKQQKLDLIYKHTHPDYKGIAGGQFGEAFEGKRMVMINLPSGSTALVPLDMLTDEQIAEKLPYAIRKEAKQQVDRWVATLPTGESCN